MTPTPELVELKKQLDSLVGVEIPFNLHKFIEALTKELERMGY